MSRLAPDLPAPWHGGMSVPQVAAELRSKVVEATQGLTCSVGVAPNMMLAKIASDKNKPNGQCMVGTTRDQVLDFIADLPVRKVRGVGVGLKGSGMGAGRWKAQILLQDLGADCASQASSKGLGKHHKLWFAAPLPPPHHVACACASRLQAACIHTRVTHQHAHTMLDV